MLTSAHISTISIPFSRTTAALFFSAFVTISNSASRDVHLHPLWSREGFLALKAFTFDNTGSLYTVDAARNAVEKFSIDGKLLKSVVGTGRGEYQFDQPVSIDARFGVDVIVADYGNRRVERYTRELSRIGSLPDLPSIGLPALGHPGNVALTRFGDVLVNDAENRRTLRFDMQGAVTILTSAELPAPRNIASEQFLSCDETDVVWILEAGKKPIFKKFDLFGASLGTIAVATDSTIDACAVSGGYLWTVSGNIVRLIDLSTAALSATVDSREEFGAEKILSIAVMRMPERDREKFVLALGSRKEVRLYSCEVGQ